MKRKLTLILAVLLMSALGQVQAQGLFNKMVKAITGTTRITPSDTYVNKEIRLTDFIELSVSGSLRVIYNQAQSSEPRVIINCPDNVLEYLEVEQKGDKLSVKLKDKVDIQWSDQSYDRSVIEVYSKSLTEYRSSGSGDYGLKGTLQVPNFKASLSGSGDFKIDAIVCSGDVNFSVTGSGDLDADFVNCQNLKARVTGSGDLEVKGIDSKEVDATVTGSGDITLKGRTEHGKLNVTGSGDIHAKELVAAGIEKKVVGSGDIYTE